MFRYNSAVMERRPPVRVSALILVCARLLKGFPKSLSLSCGEKKMLPCRERRSGVLSEAAVNTSLRRCPKSTVRFVNENQSESVRGRSPLVVISQTSALRKLRLME